MYARVEKRRRERVKGPDFVVLLKRQRKRASLEDNDLDAQSSQMGHDDTLRRARRICFSNQL